MVERILGDPGRIMHGAGRWGMKCWQHPDIAEALEEFAPEKETLDMMIEAFPEPALSVTTPSEELVPSPQFHTAV